ncbi:MAG: DUF3015 domain-containing protein [Gammaproteobacteria bacterium]|nr:DUF3015 domain-containing protein [Gammaproteobacteria bacterium]
MFYSKCCSAIAIAMLACFVTSCSVTTAPTDASSGTSGQSTDASSDLTSSTTLDDDDEDKGENEEMKEEEKKEQEVDEFVTANFSQLRTDMSVGRGEYLATLATLMSVNEADKEQFYAITKNSFASIFASSETTAKELIVNLKKEVAEANI